MGFILVTFTKVLNKLNFKVIIYNAKNGKFNSLMSRFVFMTIDLQSQLFQSK